MDGVLRCIEIDGVLSRIEIDSVSRRTDINSVFRHIAAYSLKTSSDIQCLKAYTDKKTPWSSWNWIPTKFIKPKQFFEQKKKLLLSSNVCLFFCCLFTLLSSLSWQTRWTERHFGANPILIQQQEKLYVIHTIQKN